MTAAPGPQQPDEDVALIEMAAKVIVRAKAHEFSAPYHWAYALHQAGMLTMPGGCSQAPHPGVEFYGTTGGCAECGYRPPAPPRTCCASRIGQRHAWGCESVAEALNDHPAAPSAQPDEALPVCNLSWCPEDGEHRITTGRCLIVARTPAQPVRDTEEGRR